MKLNELKAELKEKEEGCHTFIEEDEFEDPEDLFDHDIYCGNRRVRDNKLILCPTCQAKIEYLQKGISACEEILNSQHKKPSDAPLQKGSGGIEDEDEQVSNPNEPTIADTQTLIKEMSHYKSRCVDLMCENDELKKALFNRNKEILEIIRDFFKFDNKLNRFN